MATVGRIVIDVTANTAKFVKELDASANKTKSWSDRIKRTAVTALKGIATAAVAAGSAIAGMAVRGVAAGDQLVKTAQKLGVAAEALQGLRFAGQQTGVEIRQMDLGVQRMTRRIAEAAQGMGEAQGALRELGLNARELASLTVDQQFLAIADAMEGVTNASDRVRLGFKLFDSEGVALINTLGAGREALEAFFDRAQELGLYLDTTQQRVVEEAADALGEMRSSFSGLTLQLGAAFGPAIEAAAKAITNFVARMTNAIPTFIDWIEQLTGIKRAMEDLGLTDFDVKIGRVMREQLEMAERIAAARNTIATNRNRIAIVNAQGQITSGIEDMIRLQVELNDLTAARAALLRSEEEAVVAAGQALEQVIVTPVRDTVQLYGRFAGMLDGTAEALEDVSDETEELNSRTRQFGSIITNNLDFAIGRAQSLREVIRDLINDLISFAIRSAVLGGLGNRFPGIFGGALPGFAHGGSFMVGGAGGTDSQLVAFRATPGERVDVTPSSGGGPQGQFSVVNNIHVETQGAFSQSDAERLGQTLSSVIRAQVYDDWRLRWRR